MKSLEKQNQKSKKEMDKINQEYKDKCGKILEQAIKKVGLKAIEFAERVGVEKGTVSAWTSGSQLPKYAHLLKILDVLNEQAKIKNLQEYSIQHLRGDIECKNIDNEEIKKRILLTDESINTLMKLPEKDFYVGPLFTTPKPIKHVDIANSIIADENLYTIFHEEASKVISQILRDYPRQSISYQEIVQVLEKYSSDKISKEINYIFNSYIYLALKSFFRDDTKFKNKK